MGVKRRLTQLEARRSPERHCSSWWAAGWVWDIWPLPLHIKAVKEKNSILRIQEGNSTVPQCLSYGEQALLTKDSWPGQGRLNTAEGRCLGVELPMKSLCGLQSAWLLDLSPCRGWPETQTEAAVCRRHMERLAVAISTPGQLSAGMSA